MYIIYAHYHTQLATENQKLYRHIITNQENKYHIRIQK